MARDYAKKSAPKKRKRNATRRKKQGFPTAAVLIVGMLVGGFIAFLAYLKWLPQQSNSPAVVETTQSKKPETEPSKADPKTPQVPKYTFHDILEDKEVVIPEDELTRPENKVSLQYVMPCAAFGDSTNADALKAKIALLGFESKIIPIKWKEKQLYRVQLGPYASKRQAESIRHRLQRNDINDCKIWGKKL